MDTRFGCHYLIIATLSKKTLETILVKTLLTCLLCSFVCFILISIPSFGAHAKKNAFYSSRIVKKKLAVAKFGDVFIGAANGVEEDKNKEEDDGFDFGEPSSPKRSNLTAEELKKKYSYNENTLAEPSLATYLDVAVVRCLFTPQWMEEGIEWALNFLLRRLDSINQVDIESKIPYEAYSEIFRRTRSNSLPTPKRKCSIVDGAIVPATITIGNSFATNQSSSRAFKSETTQSNLLGLVDGQQLKTPSYQDLRRSSFSGLPGLAGFQALISNTASSSSFGRHGSEKSKHKKQKKQLQGNETYNGKENVKPEKKEMRHQSMRRGQGVQGGKKSQKHKAGSMKISSNEHDNQVEIVKNDAASGQSLYSRNESNAQVERPQSVTANYKLSDKMIILPPAEDEPQRDNNLAGHTFAAIKREMVAAALKKRKSSLGESRFLEKGNEKGRSMPSLNLIDQASCNDLPPSLVASTTTQPHPCVLSLPSTSEPYRCPGASTTIPTTSSHVPPSFPIITITEHSPVASKHFFDSGGRNDNKTFDSIDSTQNFCYSQNQIVTTLTEPLTGLPTITTTADDEVKDKVVSDKSTAAFYIGDVDAPGSPTSANSPRPQPPVISLIRSKTDTEINYSNTWGSLPSVASLHYVTKNGQLRLVVVLKALHAVVLKDSVCSTRICQIIYNILNKMLTLKILTKQSCQFYRGKLLLF